MSEDKDQMMSGGGAFVSTQYKKMKGAIKGYKDVTIDGKNYRI